MKFNEVSDYEVKEFKKLIASNIRKYRKLKGLTQLELALSIGHNSSALVAKAEIGADNKHFNLEQVYKISKVLDVPIEKLFIREENSEIF